MALRRRRTLWRCLFFAIAFVGLYNCKIIVRYALKIGGPIHEIQNQEACRIPPLLHHGIPWPRCRYRISSATENYKNYSCYSSSADKLCASLRYLSEIEKDCPCFEEPCVPKNLYDESADVPTNFEKLYDQMTGEKQYEWMSQRIRNMEPLWIKAAEEQFSSESPRIKKRIHVHPGLLEWGLAKMAGKGAPVGELVQWSDLIASLHIMGHDIVITRSGKEVEELYRKFIKTFDGVCLNDTNKVPFDLIYTDIIGFKEGILKTFSGQIPHVVKCKIRVLDTWGTEADFNAPDYAKKRGRKLFFYSGLGLDLRQFNTLYPHTPDNTFLGFVIEKLELQSRPQNDTQKRNIALLYAKTKDLLDKKFHYIDLIKEYFPEVHATIANWKDDIPYVVNHGVLSQERFSELLRHTKVFVGFGRPFEGPGALEAIQHGAIFSQNSYAERLGKPHVYTFDIDNDTEVREVLREVVNLQNPGGYLAFEYSARGMLQRVSVLVEKQQFCTRYPYILEGNERGYAWPPISAMKMALLSAKFETCSDACKKHSLICEPSFFPILNRKEAFSRTGISVECEKFELPPDPEMEYPAYDAKSKICYIQTNQKLFSCAGNYLGLQRLCPCRDYISQQVALCKDCLLP